MSDLNLHSFNGPLSDGNRFDLGDVDGTGYSSAIKCSTGLLSASIYAGEVIGGSDACIDINNNCRDVVVVAKTLVPTGQFAVSIKGKSDETAVYGELRAHGKSADVELGGWSDQSHEATTGTVLGMTSATGKPVRVRVLHATTPTLLPGTGPYQYLFPSPAMPAPLHRFFVWGYETLRRWGLFRRYAN